MRNTGVVSVLLLILVLGSLQEDQKRREIHLGRDGGYVETIHANGNDEKVFQSLVISKEYNSKADLSFGIKQLGKRSPITIYISNSQTQPSQEKPDENTIVCSSEENILCVYPKEKIKPAGTVSLLIVSKGPTSYRVEARFLPETSIKVGEESHIRLASSVLVVQIQVPSEGSENAAGLQVALVPENIDLISEKFYATIESIGKETSKIALSQAWNNGIAVSIPKSAPQFCTGCVYKLIIFSQVGAHFHLKTEVSTTPHVLLSLIHI
eukprot:TRINITY_DN12353_c0_g1_i4.p1 TRINITY_DN12353_c0_g1~~TRINITY_DN12353_c0_g1_i4.p1  ORF type:complete len:267 (-),score=46.55 TRINITY_DN12353_c0_g1_i4:64-864(-)